MGESAALVPEPKPPLICRGITWKLLAEVRAEGTRRASSPTHSLSPAPRKHGGHNLGLSLKGKVAQGTLGGTAAAACLPRKQTFRLLETLSSQ